MQNALLHMVLAHPCVIFLLTSYSFHIISFHSSIRPRPTSAVHSPNECWTWLSKRVNHWRSSPGDTSHGGVFHPCWRVGYASSPLWLPVKKGRKIGIQIIKSNHSQKSTENSPDMVGNHPWIRCSNADRDAANHCQNEIHNKSSMCPIFCGFFVRGVRVALLCCSLSWISKLLSIDESSLSTFTGTKSVKQSTPLYTKIVQRYNLESLASKSFGKAV